MKGLEKATAGLAILPVLILWKALPASAGLLALLWMLCPAAIAQKAPSPGTDDPFIAAIQTMRRSVASLDCLAMNGAEAKILERVGSAFLVSAAGDFLTAAHVVIEMKKRQRPCPTPALHRTRR
jgi:hypothetical protein